MHVFPSVVVGWSVTVTFTGHTSLFFVFCFFIPGGRGIAIHTQNAFAYAFGPKLWEDSFVILMNS